MWVQVGVGCYVICGGVRGCNVWVGIVVDIQQCILCVFEYYEVVVLMCLIQQVGYVYYYVGQDVGNCYYIVQYFLVVNCFCFVEVYQLEVVIFYYFFQFIGEGCFIEQIVNVQIVMSDFIFVSWVNVVIGSVDCFCVMCFFMCYVQCYVIVKDKWVGFREQQMFVNWDIMVFQVFYFFYQCGWRQYDVVIDDVGDVFMQNV